MRRALPVLFLSILGFSCQRTSLPPFDQDRAFSDLKAQVALGPRVPGTAPHAACRDWIVAQVAEAGGKAELQAFRDTVYGVPYDFANVRARFGPKGGSWILIGAHFDTRATADQDPDPTKRTQPVPGANDGASGAAILLEMARAFRHTPPPVGVELVWFDGEDLGRSDDVTGFCRGSRWYASHLVHPKPSLVIVLDLVGDKNLELYYEANSRQAAPNLVERLWAGAASVQAPAFVPQVRHNVYDDHVPFLEQGIPGIDVIDFDYPAWHTTGDDTTQVSAGSLGQVGRTVLHYIYSSE